MTINPDKVQFLIGNVLFVHEECVYEIMNVDSHYKILMSLSGSISPAGLILRLLLNYKICIVKNGSTREIAGLSCKFAKPAYLVFFAHNYQGKTL